MRAGARRTAGHGHQRRGAARRDHRPGGRPAGAARPVAGRGDYARRQPAFAAAGNAVAAFDLGMVPAAPIPTPPTPAAPFAVLTRDVGVPAVGIAVSPGGASVYAAAGRRLFARAGPCHRHRVGLHGTARALALSGRERWRPSSSPTAASPWWPSAVPGPAAREGQGRGRRRLDAGRAPGSAPAAPGCGAPGAARPRSNRRASARARAAPWPPRPRADAGRRRRARRDAGGPSTSHHIACGAFVGPRPRGAGLVARRRGVYYADGGGATLLLVSLFAIAGWARRRCRDDAAGRRRPARPGARAGTDARSITGTRLRDLIAGLGGDDVLNGRRENDILEGGDGNDTLQGGSYDDHLSGDAGDDTLNRGRGTTTVGGPMVRPRRRRHRRRLDPRRPGQRRPRRRSGDDHVSAKQATISSSTRPSATTAASTAAPATT